MDVRESGSELWQWMEQQAARSPERGLQTLLIDIAQRVEGEREAQGLTKAELARRAGFKRSYVSRLLTNPSNATLATVVRLANALSLEVNVELRSVAAAQAWMVALQDGTAMRPEITSPDAQEDELANEGNEHLALAA